MATYGLEWCKDANDDTFVPFPYPKEEFDLVEWMHCLATLDVCIVNHVIKFFDEENYDIISIQMVAIVEPLNKKKSHLTKENLHQEEILIKDFFNAKKVDGELSKNIESNMDDFNVPECEVEKVGWLLKGKEDIHLEIPCDNLKQRYCNSHKKTCK